MENIFIKVISLIAIAFLGFSAKKLSLLKSDDSRILSKIFFNITLPCTILTAFIKIEFTSDLVAIPLLGFFVMFSIMILSILITRRFQSEKRNLYMATLATYGLGSVAIPFTQNFYGALGIITIVLFDLGNVLISCGILYSVISMLSNKQNTNIKQDIKKLIKKIMTSPPFVVSITMFIFLLFKINIPKEFLYITQPIANANGFIVMFMVGLLIDFDIEKKYLKMSCTIVALKIFFNAIVAVLLYSFTPFSVEIREVLLLLSFSPIGQVSIVLIENLKGNMKAIAFINSLSIITSLVIMTIIIAWLAAT